MYKVEIRARVPLTYVCTSDSYSPWATVEILSPTSKLKNAIAIYCFQKMHAHFAWDIQMATYACSRMKEWMSSSFLHSPVTNLLALRELDLALSAINCNCFIHSIIHPVVRFVFNIVLQINNARPHTTIKFLKQPNIPHPHDLYTTHQQHSHCTFICHGT